MGFWKNIFTNGNSGRDKNYQRSQSQLNNEFPDKSKSVVECYDVLNGKGYAFPTGSLVNIVVDPFEKKKRLDFIRSISYGGGKCMFFSKTDSVEFNIGFRAIEDKKYLICSVYQKDLKLKKGDKLMFIFQNGETLSLNLDIDGYRFTKELDGVVIESYSYLDMVQINLFATSIISQMRYYSIDGTTSFDIEKVLSGTNIGFQEYAECFRYALEKYYTVDV